MHNFICDGYLLGVFCKDFNYFSDVDAMVEQSQHDMKRFESNLKVIQNKVQDAVNQKKEGQKVKYVTTKKKTREFKKPEDDVQIGESSRKKFAEKSKLKINWAMNLYDQWRSYRMSQQNVPDEILRCDMNLLGQFSKGDLSFVLCRFIREVKKMDGSDFPPNTIRELIVMIQMYLHQNNVFWKLYDDVEFVHLKNVVDNTMKERHGMGLGVRKCSDIITLSQEEKLFNSGTLGDANPLQLLRTVIYMIGLHCALRGGVEHNNLCRPGCNSQFSIDYDTFGRERLVYKEDPLQKTNQGGLMARKCNKVVNVYAASRRDRCPIFHFKKYLGLLPQSKSCKKLYLRCKKNAMPSVWYCDQPYGVNKLKSTVREICKEAGIEGHFTNHSLRATCASRMYDKNIPEQMIKEVTGHKSECVRLYKRTSDELRKEASNIVSGGECTNDFKVESDYDSDEKSAVVSQGACDVDGHALTFDRMVQNVNKTKEIRKKLVPRYKVRAKKLLNRPKKVTIDLNVNMKVQK